MGQHCWELFFPVVYEEGTGRTWIKDVVAAEWYFNPAHNRDHFYLLIKGSGGHLFARVR
jgi:hypothetical protein